jgi:hypothetical protein
MTPGKRPGCGIHIGPPGPNLRRRAPFLSAPAHAGVHSLD